MAIFKKGTTEALKMICRLQGFTLKGTETNCKVENRDLLIKVEKTGKYTRVYTEVIPKTANFQKFSTGMDGWPEDAFALMLTTFVNYKNKVAEIKHDALLKRMEMKYNKKQKI